jgi:enterochelin esterase-like enzyme
MGNVLGRRRCFIIVAVAGLLVGTTVLGSLARRTRERTPPQSGSVSFATIIADIEAGRTTTPLVSGGGGGSDATVTFLAQRLGGLVPRIVSDVTGWGEHIDGTFDFTAGTMGRIGQTDWYSLQAPVAPGARIEYLIAYGLTDYRLDPHNPRQSMGLEFGGLRASEFVSPAYVPPPEIEDSPAPPGGRTMETTVESRALGGPSRVIVYTPAGYRNDRDYSEAVFLDLRSAQVTRVLDWLIAREKIEPIVAVFVGPASRGSHVPEGEPLRTFLAGDLLAWVASRYNVSKSPSERAIIAISYGAKDALDAATSSREAFGRLGLLVPGRRLQQADIDALAARCRHHLRAAILAGQYDRANLPTARSVRQALCRGGHAVDYIEVPEGHSAVTWIHHLRSVLISLFGPVAPRGCEHPEGK